LAATTESPAGLPWIAAIVNNDVVSLSYPLSVESMVRFVAMDDPHGWRVYRRTLCFLLARAVRELYPESRYALEHSFGGGLYCTFNDGGANGISKEQLRAIEARMREIVVRNEPIIRRKIAYEEAVHRSVACSPLGRVVPLHVQFNVVAAEDGVGRVRRCVEHQREAEADHVEADRRVHVARRQHRLDLFEHRRHPAFQAVG
jgi:hypothetical protein